MTDADSSRGVLNEAAVIRAEYAALGIAPSQAETSPLTALCLSGGGIRSATFCLGVLQALAAHRPTDDQSAASSLERIHYLSTVSGGGYIGGWLSALITRSGFDYRQIA